METALSEITLVLFTTIAPAGVIGYLVMALVAMFSSEKMVADRVSRHLVVPLVLVISGLIASATHLGTPANALYVLAGVGRSPLSNEVIASVTFLAFGGVYWILSFRDDIKHSVRIAWLSLTMIAGIVLVQFIALAYSVPSVPTWNLPTAPLTLWLNALSSGLIVGLFGLLFSKVWLPRSQMLLLLIIPIAAALLNTFVLAAEWRSLSGIVTTTTRAIDLVPAFPAVIVAYAVLELASATLVALSVLRHPCDTADPFAQATLDEQRQKRAVVFTALAALLGLIACFAVRFVFYAMHMTLGI